MSAINPQFAALIQKEKNSGDYGDFIYPDWSMSGKVEYTLSDKIGKANMSLQIKNGNQHNGIDLGNLPPGMLVRVFASAERMGFVGEGGVVNLDDLDAKPIFTGNLISSDPKVDTPDTEWNIEATTENLRTGDVCVPLSRQKENTTFESAISHLLDFAVGKGALISAPELARNTSLSDVFGQHGIKFNVTDTALETVKQLIEVLEFTSSSPHYLVPVPDPNSEHRQLVSTGEDTGEIDTFELKDVSPAYKYKLIDVINSPLPQVKYDLDNNIIYNAGPSSKLASSDDIKCVKNGSDAEAFHVKKNEAKKVIQDYSLTVPLDPRIQPGMQVFIENANLRDGSLAFFVTSLSHDLNDFRTTIEGPVMKDIEESQRRDT
jgi:hypothetical protein